MIGQDVHQVIFGYSWKAKVIGVWEHGYIVKVDDMYKDQFDAWGSDLVHYPFFSGVFK